MPSSMGTGNGSGDQIMLEMDDIEGVEQTNGDVGVEQDDLAPLEEAERGMQARGQLILHRSHAMERPENRKDRVERKGEE